MLGSIDSGFSQLAWFWFRSGLARRSQLDFVPVVSGSFLSVWFSYGRLWIVGGVGVVYLFLDENYHSLCLLRCPTCIASVLNIGGWYDSTGIEARGASGTIHIVLCATSCLISQIFV